MAENTRWLVGSHRNGQTQLVWQTTLRRHIWHYTILIEKNLLVHSALLQQLINIVTDLSHGLIKWR